MNALTISHTHEEGTIIHGPARGDGTADILKAQRWRWGRSITAWYLPHSRDRLPKTYEIRRTTDALEAAGFTVELDISHDFRPAAEVEADKADRATARADALDQKADRKAAAAEQAETAQMAAFNALPPGGEPIKIGHHSERRHRNAIAKADRAIGRSIQADQDAREAARRARIAADATDRRNRPVTVANRIDKLHTDIRDRARRLARLGDPATDTEQQAEYRERLTQMHAELQDKATYWEAVRAQQITDGLTVNASRHTINPGDLVRIKDREWERVAKVNAKTLDVHTPHMPWPIRYTYGEVTAHQPAPTQAAAAG